MSAIREYDVVRVRSLDGCHGCAGLGARVPAIGDTGTVVSLLNADATTAWIASFPEHALERIESSDIAP
jgi:hypothetical protein